MEGTQASPRITRDSWGKLEVEGLGTFKDAKLWPGGGREWNWRETGTNHRPGIQPADVEELVDHGAEVVILSKGRNGLLGIRQETMDLLAARGIEVKVLTTQKAIKAYNELAPAQKVGALIHSTC